MSPMGFAVNRQARLPQYDEELMYDDDGTEFVSGIPLSARRVPIWLCVFLVVAYIIGGAFYFSWTEHWEFLDSAYFCFITLTTIGRCNTIYQFRYKTLKFNVFHFIRFW